MRLLITSYQKTGTHQLYPMFMGDAIGVPQLIDRSDGTLESLPAHIHSPVPPKPEGFHETIKEFREFSGRAFGHIPYRPEFATALQSQPTKVLFGIRDPRDVVVSEFESIKTSLRTEGRGQGLWNWMVPDTEGKTVIELDDPIAFLIESAFYRWPNWYGWLDHDFVMPVKYEKLRLEQEKTVEEIREFLTDELKDLPNARAMIKRAKPKHMNPTFRKGAVGDWKLYFKDNHIKLGKKFLNPVMERLGYEQNWSTE